MSIGESAKFLAALELSERERMIAERVTKEINARLGFLLDVGLDYLSLVAGCRARSPAARHSASASPARSARASSARCTCSTSRRSGLHQRDNRRLIDTLLRLRDLGNTVIVVEHDEETIRESDWIVDIGPGAGEHGGDVVYSGPVKGIIKVKESITGQYLCGQEVDPDAGRCVVSLVSRGSVKGAREHNLRDIDVRDPAGLLRRRHRRVRVAGKSTLVRDILLPVLMQRIYKSKMLPASQEDRRSRAPRQGDRHGPVADRAHAAIEPGDVHGRVRQHPQVVRHHGRGEGPRLHAGPVQLQRAGRSMRGVFRRRHDQDRDALPSRRLRAVRGVQGRPLQPRHARHRVQGQEHRRGARHAGRRGRRLLRQPAGDRPVHAARCSTSVSATCGSASRRPRCRVARLSE